MEKTKFVGDWSELAEVWNIDIDNNDDVVAGEIKSHIFSGYNMETDKLDENIKEVMIDYLDALIEGDTGEQEIYKAIKNLKGDYEFVQWFTNNIRYLWT